MDARSSFGVKLEEFLLILDDIIDRKNRHLERLCKDKEILFKQWPKTACDEDDKIDDIEDKKNVHVEEITCEEKHGMNLVNNLLKRAEKARIVQKKIIEKARKSEETSIELEDKVDVDESNNAKLTSSVVEADSHIDNTKQQVDIIVNEKQIGHVETNPNNEVVYKTGKDSNIKSKNVLNNKPNVQHSSARTVRNVPSQKHSAPIKSTKVNKDSLNPVRLTDSTKSTKSTLKSSRPSSTTSTRHKQMPVHMSAPFKTDPNVKVPGRRINKSSLVSSKPVIKSKYLDTKNAQNINIKTNSSARNCMINEIKTNSSANEPSAPIKTSTKISSSEVSLSRSENQATCSDKTVDQLSSTIKCDNVTVDSISANEDVKSPDSLIDPSKLVNPLEELCIEDKDEAISVSKPIFDLYRDGSSLKIPGRLKKLISQNRKLQQKVSKVSVTKKVGVSDRDKFMGNLESIFDKSSDLSLQYRKLQCLTAHTKLQQLLQQLQLENINDLSTPFDVLHAKMMVEFILTAYHDYEEETKNVLAVRNYDRSSYKPITVKYQHSLPSIWLPDNITTEILDCRDQVTYRSKKEIQKYQTALFQLQLLQLRKAILRIVQTELLPWLQKMDTSSRDYMSVYCGVYSLLTSDGNHLPALVQEILPS
ncbi:uncharacterized protein LOC126812225 [Patella vulgata]|uniref:uncharacterized protein LOC126812225 n=1 Tax=Patella vulgata TaxID=6465 RepID=UPI0024A99C8D|nr:uncharacterized protein LOC126812225 [Patella vulgata]